MRPDEDKDEPIIKDRPLGPKDRELPSGLVYGRWYGGAEQNCGCFNVPEGMHVAGCRHSTTKRAEVEAETDATPATD